jgi:hypothetical protein
MVIGEFNYEKAKSKAKIFLEESIFVLSKIMDVDSSSVDADSPNPYDVREPLYTSFECLKNEISALKKLG